jgi:Cu-Zn family superoxide dismutase
MRRLFPVLTLMLMLALAGANAQRAAVTRVPLPEAITYPEGVAYDAGRNALYTGSAETGAVARIALGSNQGTIVAPGGSVLPAEPFPALLGMKLDGRGRLWLAGGRTGRMAVIDAASGKVLAKFETQAPANSLINDLAIVGQSAYFTDSLTPTLWRVTADGDRIGSLEPWLQFAGTPLQYTTPGANLNGIAATADGKYLIVVQMNNGLLFRIGIADRSVTPIDVGTQPLTAADGLVLDGTTLYVVRQADEEVVTIQLAADLASGRVVNRFKDPALVAPATAVKVGDLLYVVNTQFNKRGDNSAARPFTNTGIPVSLLKGN